MTSGVGNLLAAFDPARLSGHVAPFSEAYAEVPETLIHTRPGISGYGCTQLGIAPTDRAQGISNTIPIDFNPRPKTNPLIGKEHPSSSVRIACMRGRVDDITDHSPRITKDSLRNNFSPLCCLGRSDA